MGNIPHQLQIYIKWGGGCQDHIRIGTPICFIDHWLYYNNIL